MAGGSDPVVTHSFFGQLRWCQPGELVGWLELDPAVQPPRVNGSRDVEVLLHVMPDVAETALADHLNLCATRIRQALERLDSARRFSAAHAPPGWAEQYAPESGMPADVLFLDGIEADGSAQVSLVFDFGDLDQLVARLDDRGNGTDVSIRT